MQPQATTITISLPNLLSKKKSRNWIAAGVLAVVAAGGGFALYRTLAAPKATNSDARGSTPTAASVSLAILPFRNASGDPSLDSLGSSVAAMLGTTIGQSAALNTVPAGRVSQILTDLKIAPDSTLDPAVLRRLAELSGADTVMWGQYLKFGNVISIDATLQDVKHQRTIPLKDAGTQRDRAAWRDRTARGVGPGEPGAVARGYQGIDRHVLQTLVQVGAGAPVLQRGSGAEPSGTAPGSPQAVRDGHAGRHRVRARLFAARPQPCHPGPRCRGRENLAQRGDRCRRTAAV